MEDVLVVKGGGMGEGRGHVPGSLPSVFFSIFFVERFIKPPPRAFHPSVFIFIFLVRPVWDF